MAKHAGSIKKGKGSTGRGCIGCLGGVLVLGVIVFIAGLMATNDSSPTTPTTTASSDETTTAAPTTTAAADGTVLASWESDWGGTTVTEALVYRQGVMSVVAISPDGDETVLFDVTERPAANPGERRFDLQPGDARSEYLVLSADGTVRYFSWEGRQFESARAKFMADDAMTRGLDPEAMVCVPVDLSPKSLEVIRLYERLQEFKDDPEFARVGFGIGGPYNEWLETIDALEDDALDVLNELGFLAGEVMMLGLEYVADNQEGISYFERLIEAGISQALCDEAQEDNRVAAPITTSTTSTTVTAAPPNPGNVVDCADFDTWEEAQAWYDTYAPHYGDVALMDINNNGVACEKLLPEGITVEQAAASLTTTATTAPTTTIKGADTTTTTTPDTTTTTTSPTTETTGRDALIELLAGLPTAAENPAGYNRDDYEHDRGYLCDTSGTDPYTGLSFQPSTCDVDHIVAAKEGHESGGYAWDRSTRRSFGNDPLNLVASRDCVNRSKGSSDPAEWSRVQSGTCGGTTITTAGRCFWTVRTISVKHRYGLSVDSAERAALRSGLDGCPDDIDIDAPPRATTRTTQPTTTTTTTTRPTPEASDCPYTSRGGDPCAAIPQLGDRSDNVNCSDIPSRLRPLTVVGTDHDRLDRDRDGRACQ